MKKRLLRISIVLVVAVVFSLQAYAQEKSVLNPAVGEFVKGKYINKSPAFTLQFPANWFAVAPQKSETFRVLSPHEWKVPVATCTITDKAKDAPELGTKAAAEAYMSELKKVEPQSSRHRIEMQDVVSLGDGTKAMVMILKWKYNETTPLISAVLQAYKADKVVSLINSTVPGEGTNSDELLKMLKTLEFK